MKSLILMTLGFLVMCVALVGLGYVVVGAFFKQQEAPTNERVETCAEQPGRTGLGVNIIGNTVHAYSLSSGVYGINAIESNSPEPMLQDKYCLRQYIGRDMLVRYWEDGDIEEVHVLELSSTGSSIKFYPKAYGNDSVFHKWWDSAKFKRLLVGPTY